MGYRGCMGYGMYFPASQLSGLKRQKKGYGVSRSMRYQGYGVDCTF